MNWEPSLSDVIVQEYNANLEFIAEKTAKQLDLSQEVVLGHLQSWVSAWQANDLVRGEAKLTYFGTEIYVLSAVPEKAFLK